MPTGCTRGPHTEAIEGGSVSRAGAEAVRQAAAAESDFRCA